MLFRARTVPLSLAVIALVLSACGGEILSAGTTGSNGSEVNGGNPLGRPGEIALATFDSEIEAFAMDATNVYVSTPDSVYRIARDGSSPPVVIAPTMTRYAWAMVTDETNVYWAALESGINGGAIFSVPKSGGTPLMIASKQARPSSIAVDETHVYWTNEGRASAGEEEGGGAVMSVPKAGGTPTTLVDDLPLADAIALDADGVVWQDHYTIRRIPKAGGAITSIFSSIDPSA